MGNSAKEFLMQAKRCEALIRNKQEERAWLYGMATSVTGRWGGESVSGSVEQDKMGNIMGKVIDLDNEINRDIDTLVDKRREIVALINSVPNGAEMHVLHWRYAGIWDEEAATTHYLSWEEIAEKLCISERTAKRIHGRALQSVEKILKNDTGCPDLSRIVT